VQWLQAVGSCGAWRRVQCGSFRCLHAGRSWPLRFTAEFEAGASGSWLLVYGSFLPKAGFARNCSWVTTMMSTRLVLGALAVAGIFASAASPLLSQEAVHVIVLYHGPPGAADLALVRDAGGRIRHSYSIVPAVAAALPSGALQGLRALPAVRSVELDSFVQATDEELDSTWGVKRIGAGEAHAAGRKGQAVKVAVIDTGIDYTHPELAGRYAGGYDFVNGNDDPLDDHGHGTHVAGTAAASQDGNGVVGAAPEAFLYALKVLNASGSGRFSDVIAALDWCVLNGIQVSNNSYGSSLNPGGAVQAAFDNSYGQGVLHAAAAGNSGNCAGKNNSVEYPARYASVIATAATNASDARPCFSSTGEAVELAAPGVTILSTLPGGGYGTASGTSMASPHVAGTAALLFEAGVGDANGNGRINDEVREILQQTAQDLGAAGRDPHYGFGLVRADLAVAALGGSEPAPEPAPAPAPAAVVVESVSYATAGGRNNDKDLYITVKVADGEGGAVGGASLAIEVTRNGSFYGSASGTTAADGTVTFKVTNAPAGCYSTRVTAVTAAGLEWDGITPGNEFCK
jgi:subtilisin